MLETEAGSRTSVHVGPRLDPAIALDWLSVAPGSAMALVATCASGCPVLVELNVDGEALLTTAATRALVGDQMRTLLWHAEGTVAVGSPIAIVGVAAEHRKDALAAVDAILARLKGVAKRTDLERESP